MSKTIIAVRHFGLGGRKSLETAVIVCCWQDGKTSSCDVIWMTFEQYILNICMGVISLLRNHAHLRKQKILKNKVILEFSKFLS